MSTNNKTRILSFLFGLAIGFTFIGTYNGCCTSQDSNETYTNNVVVSVDVKDEWNSKTNQYDRATQNNVQWFQDSSTYIWDSWKIK